MRPRAGSPRPHTTARGVDKGHEHTRQLAMNPFYVYVLFRPWDGSPFYVGKGKGNRWLSHEKELAARPHRNPHMAAILAKAARLGMEVPRVKIRTGLLECDAFAIERAFIGAIGRKINGGPLVNLTDGGDGTSGHTPPPGDKERRSAATKKNWGNPEYRAACTRHLIGNKHTLGYRHRPESIAKIKAYVHTPEARAIMSAASKGNKNAVGRKHTEEHKKKMSALFKGRKNSEETRRKISEGRRGILHTEEAKAKMSAAHKGKIISAEQRAKQSATVKRQCLDPAVREMKRRAAQIRWAGRAHQHSLS